MYLRDQDRDPEKTPEASAYFEPCGEDQDDLRRLCRRNFDIAFNSLSMINWTLIQRCMYFKNIFGQDYFDLEPENCTLPVIMDDCVDWVQEGIEIVLEFNFNQIII